MIGNTISHYRITEKLGSGGMGEVYRAEDTNLNRQVAIKVLPDIFVGDPERLARFEREAKLLASLNHLNIAAIYGLEEAGGKRFLVLELVEGETLAQRIAKGPLPVDETLDVCRQIAEGLEAAHEKGIIHRDLKPANVKITPEGKVKVLDFGLAKAIRGDTPATDASKSPTLTDQMTQAGVILGTAAYMAPEQAKGKAVDKRADIWAFGCILYECLTGKRAFEGETVTETLAAILKGEPDWQALPVITVLNAKDLLHRCLERDPRRRLHDIADARIEIDDALSAPVTSAAAEFQDKQHRAPQLRLLALGLKVGAAITGGMVIGALLWNLVRETRPTPQPPIRFVLPLPLADTSQPVLTRGPILAISPDGRRLVYVAAPDGTRQLFRREMDQFEAFPIAGTVGAYSPFFSPDGGAVGFFDEKGKLKKVSMADGSCEVICDNPGPIPRGATWGTDGSILYSPKYNIGISQVSAGGGKPQPITITNPSQGDYSHSWPQIFPGGRAMLFTISSGSITTMDDAQTVVQQLGTGERHSLKLAAGYARYLPTGHIVYARAGALFAVPFDTGELRITGLPKQIIEGVMMDDVGGVAQFAFSDTGTLAYIPGHLMQRSSLVWVDRHGGTKAVSPRPASYQEPRLSPDGRVAVRIAGANDDLHVYEATRDNWVKLTDEAGDESCPVWTPDGKRVAYSSESGGPANLIWRPADGSGPPEVLLKNENQKYASSFSPDGKYLAFVEVNPSTRADIWLLSVTGDRKPQLLLQTQYDEWAPRFSLDGRWLAYTSNSTGRDEVYILDFPEKKSLWKISNDGGNQPVWARNGQLFYRNGRKMMSVSIDPQSGKPSTPWLMFEGNYIEGGRPVSCFDVDPDGQNFLMTLQLKQETRSPQINVILNWFEDLKRLVPTGKK